MKSYGFGGSILGTATLGKLGALGLLSCLLAGSVHGGSTDGSVAFFENLPGAYDYGLQLDLPPTFGAGEFTLELWIQPDLSFPVGPTDAGTNQLMNWSDSDEEPYSSCCWWFAGNFLLDGHNNNTFSEGTFSLQFYGGGRLRWLVGDGASSVLAGGIWSVGAFPASTTPSLLDGQWHRVNLVRRWSGLSDADYELWIDGILVDTETSPTRVDFRTWWDDWSTFPIGQEGWFWAAEKQAAIGALEQYEDYKGPLDALLFFDRALSPAEIALGACETSTGRVGSFPFDEGMGAETCALLDAGRCMDLIQGQAGLWSDLAAPGCAEIFGDGFESGDVLGWDGSVP